MHYQHIGELAIGVAQDPRDSSDDGEPEALREPDAEVLLDTKTLNCIASRRVQPDGV